MNEKTLRVLEYNKIKALLLEKAESQLGRELINGVKPRTNMDDILTLLDETDEALSILINRGSPPLFGIHNIGPEVRRAEIGGSLTPGALLKVSDSLRVSRSLKEFIKDDKSDKASSYPIIEGLIRDLRVFKSLEDEINNAIISENEISDNASNTLRSIRRQILGKNEAIRSKLNSIINSQTHKKYLQDSIVTIREGRFVIPVKQENRGNIPGLVHDISSSGATVFVEPMAVVELNNELRELEIKEREEIARILAELSSMVAAEADAILNNQNILQYLDFVFAKGKLALDMKATKPSLNDRGFINIKKARHPILDVENVVPIDIYLGDEFTSLVITGPNTGGKTVTLKTVGLLTLMAQSGLHIPADYNSEIAVFDQIFADIGDEQSIEQSLSTFSSHMTNIVDILNNVGPNSLVLFDELGAGTDPTEGAALAMSILDHLLKMQVRTIATTHYSQLKLYALTTENVRNASVEFDVETLRPTYRLLIGVPGKSNAFEISRRLGLQDYIISYARDLISQENIEFEDVLQAIERDRIKTEESREEAERLKKEIEDLREDLAKEKEKTRRMREDIIRKAKEEARDILQEAKIQSDLIISELRDISRQVDREKNRRIQEAKDMLSSQIDELDNSLVKDLLNVKSKKPPKNLKIGETVEVLSLNQKGEVLSRPDENGNVTVQVGIMKVNVHISTLRRTSGEVEAKQEKKSKTLISSKSKTIKNELDIRGRTIEEAILELDKYIDDSYLAGFKEVYIIHGKGTGALREGLQSYFKQHRLIKSHRIGKYAEGGTGVTVLEIK